MSAPDRIWAYTNDEYGERMTDHGTWDTGIEGQPDCHPEWPHAPYIRADLCNPTQDERVKVLEAENARLRDALSLYSCGDGCNDCPEHERDIVGCGWTARAALGKDK